MKGLDYPQFVYKQVLNEFITDDEINVLLNQLNINKYATLERFQDKLLIQFEFQGDRFINLSDLINYTKKNNTFIDLDYAIIIINSILTVFQNNYYKNTENVNFNINEIWVGNQLQSEKQVEVIFTSFNFCNQQNSNPNPNIQQLKETIQELLELFCQNDSYKIKEIQKKLKECNKINDIQTIIKKNLANCQQFQINNNSVYIDQHLDNILNQPNEMSQSMNQQNYRVLRSNLINWIIKSNIRFKQIVTIKDIFQTLNLEASYKLFTQWSDVNDIFQIIKENETLNELSSLQNINNFIFQLAFPTYHLIQDGPPPIFYSQQTIQWIELVENLIFQMIELYIANILSFYKGDKDDWKKLDFKCIFNQVRKSFAINLQESNDLSIISNCEFVKYITLNIIQQHYEKKVEELNQEIIRIIFKANKN